MDTTTSIHPLISSDRVEGTAVYDSAGEKIGSIDTLMIDKRSGQVHYAVMEFGGFLGMGTDRYPVPWDSLKYDVERGGYVAPLDKARLEGAPKYAEDEEPAYDEAYTGRVRNYYSMDI